MSHAELYGSRCAVEETCSLAAHVQLGCDTLVSLHARTEPRRRGAWIPTKATLPLSRVT